MYRRLDDDDCPRGCLPQLLVGIIRGIVGFYEMTAMGEIGSKDANVENCAVTYGVALLNAMFDSA